MNNFNMEDYLTEDEKKRIAEDAFCSMCISKFKDDAERIFSNAAFDCVSKMCEIDNEDVKEKLAKKTIEIIDGLSSFTFFQKPDAWGRDGNSNYHLLKYIVEENKHKIESKLDSVIDNMNLPSDFEIDINYKIEEMVMARLFGGSKND